MTPQPEDLVEAYARALEAYVAAPSEAAREAAYELGREAIARRLAMVDLAAAHQRTLARLLAARSEIPPAVLGDRAMEFLLEALSPFEMTLGGFRDAVDRLQDEVGERARAQEELRVAHDHLEERVQQRTAELYSANERLRQEVAERGRAERARREAETSYASLVASVQDYAIFMLDPNGLVTSWNPGAQQIKGYLAHEIIGTHFSVFYSPEDRERGHPAEVLARAVAEGSYQEEGWRVRKDGARYWADVTVTARSGEDGTLEGFTTVARDTTERRHAQEALEELNAQLQRSNEEKDQFVAMVSHELRNPLAAVVSGIEVLGATGIDDPRARRALDVVRRNAAVQKRLVDDLLDFSRLRRGRLALQRAPVALDSLAQTSVNAEEAAAAAAGVTLALDADEGCWVVGDGDRLQQAMLNLLGNAVKFTPAGGRVDVGVFGCVRGVEALGAGIRLERADPRRGAASVCFVVDDTGAGIDGPLLARLFQPFQQGEVAGGHQRGLGLGLALVRLIAEKHGGTVWGESSGPNRGSRFVVALPALHAAPASQDASRHGPICLLLVEDHDDTRAVLEASLQADGYRVLAASDGETALALLATTRPDMILSDLGLPGISGYEFLQRARQLEGMGHVPAFAVTAHDLDEDLRHAREAGFEGHFAKPIDPRALDQAIRAWFAAPARGAPRRR